MRGLGARLRDRPVLLVEPLEAPVQLVEVAEHFGPEVVDAAFKPIEALVDGAESLVDDGELAAGKPVTRPGDSVQVSPGGASDSS